MTGRGLGRATALMVTVLLDNALRGGSDGTAANAAGSFDGNVTYSGLGGSTVCTENSWTLTPR